MRSWTGLCAALLLSVQAAVAAPAPGGEALELVRVTTDKVLKALRTDAERLKKEPGRLNMLVDDLVLPHFDFERISRWVLGKHWNRASPEQQKVFIEEFRSLMVRTYAKSLLEYRDQQIVFLPVRPGEQPDEVEIRTEIQQQGGFPIPIAYSLYRKGAAWKVFDVNIDGVSLVANYRTSFAKEVRESGIDGLIKRLRERNEQSDTRKG